VPADPGRNPRRTVTTVVLAALAVLLSAAPAVATETSTRRARALTAVTGYGAWVDLWDYDRAKTGTRPAVTTASIDAMAANGVQVVMIQSSRPGGAMIADPTRLAALVRRAKAHRLRVVLWYLPSTKNLTSDLAHLRAAAGYPGVDAVGVDAEDVGVTPVSLRNQRLVTLLQRLHAAVDVPVITITPSPTAMALWAPKTWWPNYPFAAVAPFTDAFMTMSYWASHKAKGQTTAAAEVLGDITRLRAAVPDPTVPLHVIGSPTTSADIADVARVLTEQNVAGGSVYDWASTKPALYSALRGLRR
jgi:hypothetical protein